MNMVHECSARWRLDGGQKGSYNGPGSIFQENTVRHRLIKLSIYAGSSALLALPQLPGASAAPTDMPGPPPMPPPLSEPT